MLRTFFLGFIQIHLLYHATREPIYGAAMIAELKRHGYDISPGTLYPLLHSLEESGYIRHTAQVIEGRVRKYYVATEEGKRVLQELLPKLRELVSEVLEEQERPSLLASEDTLWEAQKGREDESNEAI